jgi:hypothetical protein
VSGSVRAVVTGLAVTGLAVATLAVGVTVFAGARVHPLVYSVSDFG